MAFAPFPNRILAANKKGKDYTLLVAKAIKYAYDSNISSICSRDSSNFADDKLYAEARQSEERYKDHFSLERDNKTGKRKGLGNLDYRIVPIAPNFMNVCVALLSDKTNRTNVVFLNDLFDDKRNDIKLGMQSDIENAGFYDTINNARGVKTPRDKNLPENVRDLDVLEQVGGIKLPQETALEMGIDYVFNYVMQWEKKTSAPIKRDLLSSGFSLVVDTVNPVTGMIEVRKPNIENVIMDGSATNDFKDMQYFGEVRKMTVLEVYNQVKATTKIKITENDLKELALSSNESYRKTYSENVFDVPTDSNLHGLLPTRIDVLDFVYKSVDIIDAPTKKGKKVRITGKVKKSEIKSGKIKQDEDGYYKVINKKSNKLEVTTWRRGKWVIDSKIVFDYGLVYEQVRNNDFEPLSNVHAFRISGKAFIPTIKSNIDAIQFDLLKIQSLKNEATGYGLAINYDGLANLKLGGDDYDVKKLISMYKLKNVLLYKPKKSSNPNDKTAGTPIQEIQGGIGNFYNELLSDIQFNFHQMQINTGMNDVVTAQNPNPETTFGQAQQAVSASNNSIAYLYNAYKTIKESVAYSIAIRLQNLAKKGEGKQYSEVLGEDLWKVLKKGDSIRRDGIKIMDNPSKDEIQMLFANMQRLAPNTLTVYDRFLIESMTKEGKPLRAISAIMEGKIKKREEEASKNNEMMMQKNAEQQQTIQQQGLQAEKEKEVFKAQVDAKSSEQDFTQKRILQGTS